MLYIRTSRICNRIRANRIVAGISSRWRASSARSSPKIQPENEGSNRSQLSATVSSNRGIPEALDNTAAVPSGPPKTCVIYVQEKGLQNNGSRQSCKYFGRQFDEKEKCAY